MEISLETPISAIAVHPNQFDQICLGHLDGEISCCFFNKAADGGPEKRLQFEKKWKRWMKSAARALKFSDDGSALFVTSSNRAICMFDTETGKKLRCIQKGHASRPNALSVLTPTTSGEYNFATGAESGEIKLWDFRQSKPQIATFNEQEDTINAFDIWKSSLLAASDDGTLAAYDLRKQKLATQSEAMHSELLSLALTGSSTYAGAADGHIEVFNNGEYGNIRERIETPLLMGVEQLLKIRESNLLLAGSSTHEKMSFVHVRPNKCLGGIPYAEGIDLLEKTADSSTLLATSADGTKLMLWPLSDLINDVPELRSQEMRKFNEKQKEERKKLKRPANGDFFEDMFDQETDEEEEENGDADDQSEE